MLARSLAQDGLGLSWSLGHDSSQHIFGGATFDWRWLNGGGWSYSPSSYLAECGLLLRRKVAARDREVSEKVSLSLSLQPRANARCWTYRTILRHYAQRSTYSSSRTIEIHCPRWSQQRKSAGPSQWTEATFASDRMRSSASSFFLAGKFVMISAITSEQFGGGRQI